MYANTNGAANNRLSKRSNTPPCPGNNVPESFLFASRFNFDSNKSPSGANIPTMTPMPTPKIQR